MKYSFVVLCLAAVNFTACGGSGTVPAGGTVKYKGKPVGDANIVFTPSESPNAKIATGKTDAEGKFTLTTDKPGDGAVPGDYRVSLTPNLPPPKEGDYSAPPPPPFPIKFSNAGGSPLKAKVEAGGSPQMALELTD